MNVTVTWIVLGGTMVASLVVVALGIVIIRRAGRAPQPPRLPRQHQRQLVRSLVRGDPVDPSDERRTREVAERLHGLRLTGLMLVLLGLTQAGLAASPSGSFRWLHVAAAVFTGGTGLFVLRRSRIARRYLELQPH